LAPQLSSESESASASASEDDDEEEDDEQLRSGGLERSEGVRSAGIAFGRTTSEKVGRTWEQVISDLVTGSDYIDSVKDVPQERSSAQGVWLKGKPPLRLWQCSDLDQANSIRVNPMAALRRGFHVLSFFGKDLGFCRCTMSVDEEFRTLTFNPEPGALDSGAEAIAVEVEQITKVIEGEAAVKICMQQELMDGHISGDSTLVLLKEQVKAKLHAPVKLDDLVFILASPLLRVQDSVAAVMKEGVVRRQVERLGAACTDQTRCVSKIDLLNPDQAIFSSTAPVFDLHIAFADGRSIFTELLIGLGEKGTLREVDAVCRDHHLMPADAAELRTAVMEYAKLRAWALEGVRDIFTNFPWSQFTDAEDHQAAMDDLDEEEIEALQDQLHRCKQRLEGNVKNKPLSPYHEAAARAATHALLNLLVSEGELKRCLELQFQLEENKAEADARLAEARQNYAAESMASTPTLARNISNLSSPAHVRDLLYGKATGSEKLEAFQLRGASMLEERGEQRNPVSRFPPAPLQGVQPLLEDRPASMDSDNAKGLGRADAVPCVGTIGFRPKDCRSM